MSRNRFSFVDNVSQVSHLQTTTTHHQERRRPHLHIHITHHDSCNMECSCCCDNDGVGYVVKWSSRAIDPKPVRPGKLWTKKTPMNAPRSNLDQIVPHRSGQPMSKTWFKMSNLWPTNCGAGCAPTVLSQRRPLSSITTPWTMIWCSM